jgi:tRNA (guanine37-N1)-methyltransferase
MHMKIDILTLFPQMFSGVFDESIIKRAKTKGFVEIKAHDLRRWTVDNYKTVDDRMFGGGVGMLMKVEVIHKAVKQLISNESENSKLSNKNKRKSATHHTPTTKVILLDARGKVFDQKKAVQLSKLDHLILIAGHYEGVDYRVHEHIVDEVISIGDYILTGGEIPAMVVIDASVRQIPGVIVKPDAIKNESFSITTTHNSNPVTLLESPQYTRPTKYLEWEVPKILMSGNHAEIEKWQLEQSLELTKKIRPDLLNTKPAIADKNK